MAKDIEDKRAEIEQLYIHRNMPIKKVLRQLNHVLKRENRLEISEKTLKNRCKNWGLKKYRDRASKPDAQGRPSNPGMYREDHSDDLNPETELVIDVSDYEVYSTSGSTAGARLFGPPHYAPSEISTSHISSGNDYGLDYQDIELASPHPSQPMKNVSIAGNSSVDHRTMSNMAQGPSSWEKTFSSLELGFSLSNNNETHRDTFLQHLIPNATDPHHGQTSINPVSLMGSRPRHGPGTQYASGHRRSSSMVAPKYPRKALSDCGATFHISKGSRKRRDTNVSQQSIEHILKPEPDSDRQSQSPAPGPSLSSSPHLSSSAPVKVPFESNPSPYDYPPAAISGSYDGNSATRGTSSDAARGQSISRYPRDLVHPFTSQSTHSDDSRYQSRPPFESFPSDDSTLFTPGRNYSSSSHASNGQVYQPRNSAESQRYSSSRIMGANNAPEYFRDGGATRLVDSSRPSLDESLLNAPFGKTYGQMPYHGAFRYERASNLYLSSPSEYPDREP